MSRTCRRKRIKNWSSNRWNIAKLKWMLLNWSSWTSTAHCCLVGLGLCSAWCKGAAQWAKCVPQQFKPQKGSKALSPFSSRTKGEDLLVPALDGREASRRRGDRGGEALQWGRQQWLPLSLRCGSGRRGDAFLLPPLKTKYDLLLLLFLSHRLILLLCLLVHSLSRSGFFFFF